MTKTADFPLWTFSAERYARPGVSEICLKLQDEHGVDVNIMFFCLFLANEGIAVDAATLRQSTKDAAEWQRSVVVPLRGVRRHLKSGDAATLVAPLREAVKRIELDSEKQEQFLLSRAYSLLHAPAEHKTRAAVASENLGHYCALLGVEVDGSIAEMLHVLVTLCF